MARQIYKGDYPSVTRTYKANGTITRAGDWVKFDTSKTGSDRGLYVIEGTASALTFGVAKHTAVAGDDIEVYVSGYVEGVQTDNSVASGNAIVAKAAGEVGAYVNTDVLPVLGVALENDAGADPFLCDIILFQLVP